MVARLINLFVLVDRFKPICFPIAFVGFVGPMSARPLLHLFRFLLLLGKQHEIDGKYLRRLNEIPAARISRFTSKQMSSFPVEYPREREREIEREREREIEIERERERVLI